MTKYICPNCGLHIEAPDELAETEVSCPGCGKITLLVRPESHTAKQPKLAIAPITESKGLWPKQVTVPAIAQQIIASVEKVIVGKREKIVLAVATLLAEGHLLIEDVPGVAKTMLARAIAQSAGCSFKRVQCTPDLEPVDILGESFQDLETGQSDFRFGPLFSQFVLVDEINRASPRTQAALLEAMGEASITEGKVTYQMARPFMVIATQNPIEQEGTFLLPEAQKDRFLIRISLGYPSLQDEKEMCERFQLGHPIETLKAVTKPDQILACQEVVKKIKVNSEATDYILSLVRATRENPVLLLGASPRGSLGLFRMAQAMSAIEGSDSVSIQQIRAVATAVLAHRLIVMPDQKHRFHDCGEIIRGIIEGKKTG